MNDSNQKGIKPPYVAYSTFRASIDSFRQSGIPDRIDRSVFPGQSGSAQSYIIATLRFFRLIDDKGKPTPELVKLTQDKDNEKANLASLIKTNYAFLFSGSFNPESASEAQFLDKFKEFDLNGETGRKCLSLFVSLCNAAEIKLSPHLKGVRAANGNTPRRPYKKRRGGDEIAPPVQPQRSFQEALLDKFPTFDTSWDAETQKKWFDAFEKFQQLGK